MTEEEKTFKRVCDGITAQNRQLLDRLQQKDFDPGVELDCTRNNASYKLTDFFDALKYFEYGEAPVHFADDTVKTTDELIDAIIRRYPKMKMLAVRTGQAFRRSKRIWRIASPLARVAEDEYHRRLDECLRDILDAIDDLNAALDAPLPPPKPHTKRRRTPFMEKQLKTFGAYLKHHPVTPSQSPNTLAHRCWIDNREKWDAAAESGEGYADYKKLARAY